MSSVEGQRNWTVKEIMVWSVGFLKERASPSPRLDVELLLARALHCTRVDLYTGIEKPLNPSERGVFRDYLKRRAAGEPIAYITGERDFYGLQFAVDARVLIPRPETELVIEAVLADVKNGAAPPGAVLDVGTGSGCIAITLARLNPKVRVEAWDISAEALTVARANAERHTVDVTFRQCDAKDAAAWLGEPCFDYIVSNPPYIALGDPALESAVKRYEPHLALFADGDGLTFYRRIAASAGGRIKSNGKLILEIGATLAGSVSRLLAESGWTEVTVTKDLSGTDRLISARRGDDAEPK